MIACADLQRERAGSGSGNTMALSKAQRTQLRREKLS